MSLLFLLAALPPSAESIKEWQALLADPRLYQALTTQEQIQEIRREDDHFLIQTQEGSLQVDIHYHPQKHLGPAQFSLSAPRRM